VAAEPAAALPRLADLVDADGHPPCSAPSITFDGDDIGT
jgi:hypothetical protein